VNPALWHGQLAAMDAGVPWFEPWQDVGNRVAAAMKNGAALHEALNRQADAPVRFVPAQDLPPGMAYEQFVFERSACPVHEGPHDFFNGLAWLQLPRAKRQLNRVQAAQIAAEGVRGGRGPVRDAATLFDENGAVLCAPEPLWQALAARDWYRLFVELRPLWDQARLVIAGHALLEKLLAPRKNLTAHVWAAPCPDDSLAGIDGWLEGQLTPARLAAKPFLPLPVMGLPGWSPGNADFSFYDDPLVFRPAGRQEPKITTPSAASRP